MVRPVPWPRLSEFASAPKEQQIEKIKEYKNGLFREREKLGSQIDLDERSFVNKIKPLEKEVSQMQTGHAFTTTEKSGALSNIKLLLDKAKAKKGFTGEDLYNLKKEINSVWNAEGTKAAEIQKRMLRAVNEEIDKVGSSYPEWHQTLRQSDMIHGLENWESGITQYFKDNKKEEQLSKLVKNEVAQAALIGLGTGVGYLKGGGLGALTGSVTGYGLKELFKKGAKKVGERVDISQRVNKLTEYLKTTPKARKVLETIMADGAKYAETRNKAIGSSLAKNLFKLNSIADKFDEENPDINNNQEYTVIDPSRIQFVE